MDAEFLVNEINAALDRGQVNMYVHLPGAGIPVSGTKHPAAKAELDRGYVRVTAAGGDAVMVIDAEYVRMFESAAPTQDSGGTGAYS